MKVILIELFVIILAVQEIKARFGLGWLNKYHMIPPNTIKVEPNLEATDKLVDIQQLIREEFEKLEHKMEEKFADLHKALKTRKTREVNNFEQIGSKYYYLEHSEKVNWFVAAYKCEEKDAKLAVLQSVQELNEISEKLINNNYWLNINDLGHDGVFILQNSGQNVDNLNLPWHKGEPNNGNGDEHCVELKKIGSKYAMNNGQCLAKLNFICEKNKLE